ncbi:MAG: LamB/YcsF family protein [Actinobacteria bacterium]|nr:LamB/YcsF family protein [Actinomycetota bacterium]
MPKIDLNADLGEGIADHLDLELLDLITSANVACGGHAGDEATMTKTVRGAKARGVRIGAHPSYPDRVNFGRRSLPMGIEAIRTSVEDQVRTLMKIAEEEAAPVIYIKPHGALYNDASLDSDLAGVVLSMAKEMGLMTMLLAGSPMADREPSVIREGFLDRSYMPDGSLVPRSEPGALLTDPEKVSQQALLIAPRVDSLCIHSDTPNAVTLLKHAVDALENEGYEITAS